MKKSNYSILQQYIKLTEFLGRTLGPDYEIVLHSLEDREKSIIAIANSHVSGQELGAPLASEILRIISDKSYHNNSYRTHYMGVTAAGKKLRSSTLFIEDRSGELIGLLSINFDDSKYTELAKQLIGLCHPDTFVETNFRYDETFREMLPGAREAGEGSRGLGSREMVQPLGEPASVSSAETVKEALSRILRELNLEGKSLSPFQRLSVMEHMERDGLFLLKGAVRDTAGMLGISQASAYRYLSKIRRESKEP